MDFDRDNPTPLYIRLYQALKKELPNIPVGSNLPPERQLCEQYKVDRVTVRKALSMLAQEQLIERRQGRGTCVLRHPVASDTCHTVLFALYHGSHMLDRLGEPFYARSLDALEKQLQRSNKRLVYSKVRREDSLIQLCNMLDAQAVILAGTVGEQIVSQCRTLNLPVVGYNTYMGDLPSVMPDNEGGAALSAQHLLALGHRRIGFINVPGYVNSEKRLSRFQSEMRRAGLDERMLTVAEGDWTEDSGYAAATSLLKQSPDITAIFGGNDSMAIGAMRAARDLALNVPEQLSVSGFDGIAQSALTQPPLTTVQVDINAMAEAACMLLTHMMAHGMTRGIHAVAATDLVLRGSTAAPRG